jgi:hypothetical protein
LLHGTWLISQLGEYVVPPHACKRHPQPSWPDTFPRNLVGTMHACLAVRGNLSSHMLRPSDQTGLARGHATRT